MTLTQIDQLKMRMAGSVSEFIGSCIRALSARMFRLGFSDLVLVIFALNHSLEFAAEIGLRESKHTIAGIGVGFAQCCAERLERGHPEFTGYPSS